MFITTSCDIRRFAGEQFPELAHLAERKPGRHLQAKIPADHPIGE
jgi:hypothetical protein